MAPARILIVGGGAAGLTVASQLRRARPQLAITVLEDVCAAPNAEWHRFSMESIMPLFATVATTDTLG